MSIQQIANWFTTSTPEPTHQNFNTQTGIHFEEVAEMLETISGMDPVSQARVEEALKVMTAFADDMKRGDIKVTIHDPEEFLDAVCDQIVTATGVATLANMDVSGALQQVADSNDSKFVDGKPIRDPDTQKIKKGPDYFAPHLDAFRAEATFVTPPLSGPDAPLPYEPYQP